MKKKVNKRLQTRNIRVINDAESYASEGMGDETMAATEGMGDIGDVDVEELGNDIESVDDIDAELPVQTQIDIDKEDEDDDDLNDNVEIDDEDKDMTFVDDKQADDAEVYEEKCFYENVDKDPEDEDDADIEEIFDDDNKEYSNIVSKEERITKPFLTKYERVRLIGDRTRQLSLGAKAMIKNAENLPSKEIAELELKYNVLPLFIERPLPNGKRERWYISELEH